MNIAVYLVHRLFQLLTLIVLIKVILSYFMSPYHPVREFFDRIVEPFLQPIRRVLPSTGMIDFSPLVLFLVIQILDVLITGFLAQIT